MTGIHYIGLQIGLHGTNLPETDGMLEGRVAEALRAAFPDHFAHDHDVTVEITESARS